MVKPISYREFLNLYWANQMWGKQAPDFPLYRDIFKSLADFGAIEVKGEKKGEKREGNEIINRERTESIG